MCFTGSPCLGSAPILRRLSDIGCDRAVPGVGVPEVDDAVIIVILIPVILQSVTVEITWPYELIDTCIIVIVLIIRSSSRSVNVLICDAVVVMVEGVLIHKITRPDNEPSPGVNCGWRHVTIRSDVPWISPLSVVDRSL